MEQIKMIKAELRIVRLCLHYLINKLDLSEELELLTWRQLSPDNEKLFRGIVDHQSWEYLFLTLSDKEIEILLKLLGSFQIHASAN